MTWWQQQMPNSVVHRDREVRWRLSGDLDAGNLSCFNWKTSPLASYPRRIRIKARNGEWDFTVSEGQCE